jgi:hypothetical protein
MVEGRFAYAVEIASSKSAGQDRAGVFARPGGLVIALADGAGGTGNGEIAAQALVDAVSAAAEAEDWPALVAALDRDVARLGHGQSTVVVISVDARGITGCSVGDSGAWLVRDDVVDLTDGQTRKPRHAWSLPRDPANSPSHSRASRSRSLSIAMMTAAAPGLMAIDVLAARPLIATVEARHADTVMDLSVTGDVVATIDFAGNWAVWHHADLRRLAGGSLIGRVGRRVAVTRDGRRLAVLTGSEGIDFKWRAAIIEVATGDVAPFGGTDFRRIAWTDAGLIAMGPLGYRLNDPIGRLLIDGHHQAEPGSAWMGSVATRDGSRI